MIRHALALLALTIIPPAAKNYQIPANWIGKDYVCPEWYGALGDGKHDDTEAFVKAAATNSHLKLQGDKVYVLSSKSSDHGRNCAVVVKHDLHVEGNNATIKIADHTHNLFSVFLPELNKFDIDVSFTNLVVDFNAEHNKDVRLDKVKDRRYFFRCDMIKSFTATKCHFIYNGTNALLIRKADRILIDSCRFEWISFRNFDNSSVTVGTKARGKGIVQNCYFAPKDYQEGSLPVCYMFGGIEVQGEGGIDVIHNTFKGIEKAINISDISCTKGIDWNYDDVVPMTGAKNIDNNTFTDCRTSITFWSYANAIDNISIKNNTCIIGKVWYDEIGSKSIRKLPQFVSTETAKQFSQQDKYAYYGKLGRIVIDSNTIVNRTDWKSYWNRYKYSDKNRGCIELLSLKIGHCFISNNTISDMPGCIFMYGLRYPSSNIPTSVNVDIVNNNVQKCVGVSIQGSYPNAKSKQSVFVYLRNDTDYSKIFVDGNKITGSNIGLPIQWFDNIAGVKETVTSNNLFQKLNLPDKSK